MSHSAAFVGVGHSPVYRHDDVALGTLAVDAAVAAVSDAGLSVDQIDGIACVDTQPFAMDGLPQDGCQYVSAGFMARRLKIQPRWGENQSGSVANSCLEAINAVEAGACNYALVVRAMHSPTGAYGHVVANGVSGVGQFVETYGHFYPATWGRQWTRYQQLYGTGTREQMATLVTQSRSNGLLWEHGYWCQRRPQPLTVAEYLAARPVSTPLSVFDCDLPVQGCGAFVITTAQRAADLQHPPAFVRGVAAPLVDDTVNLGAFPLEREQSSGRRLAADLWHDSGLWPKDVDVANLYDGFSFIAMMWLEALGFCGLGEAFDFVQEGRIALDGELPLNTSGGNLGAGRMHGVPHIMDSVLQVMGRSGPRQVAGAQVALATVGPQTYGAALLLASSAEW